MLLLDEFQLFSVDQIQPLNTTYSFFTLTQVDMMDEDINEDINEDRAKLKQGIVKALHCVAAISSAAAVVNPIFGVAGCLMRVVLHHVDDEDIRTLKREFSSVRQKLDTLSQENRNTLMQIKKETLDSQYGQVEENLKNQFRKFMDLVEARPEHRESKKKDYEDSYSNDLGDQNLHTLYDGVVGKPKLFSRPILEVYLKHSQGDRPTMERLCTRLTYLFCIGPHRPDGLRRRHRGRWGEPDRGVGREDGACPGEDAGGSSQVPMKKLCNEKLVFLRLQDSQVHIPAVPSSSSSSSSVSSSL